MRRAIPMLVALVATLTACGGGGDRTSATVDDPGRAGGTTDAAITVTTPAPGESAAVPPSTTGRDASERAPATTAGTRSAADVPEALQFTAPLVGGGELDATALAGAPVLFWFWAPY